MFIPIAEQLAMSPLDIYYGTEWLGLAIFFWIMWFVQILITYGKKHFGEYDHGLIEAKEKVIKYSDCGCSTDAIVCLDDDKQRTIDYLKWAESVGIFGDKSQCWYCYKKQNNL